MILTIRTDKPEAEIGLFDQDGMKLAYEVWEAHRKLADTLLEKVHAVLAEKNADFPDVTGVVVFRGPGSFTGLRIGITVANALGYGQDISVVGAMGEEWIRNGVARIANGENDKIVLPEYGADATITKQKK